MRRVMLFYWMAALAGAQNWPQFRGAGATGIADGWNVPLAWNAETGANLAWKTPVPGLGHSSPVIWGDRIFVTTAVSTNPYFKPGAYGDGVPVNDNGVQSYRVLCLDLKSGRILWNQKARDGEPRIQRHPKNTHASPTPATDGKRVIAFFGSEGLYAYDFAGKLLWKKDLGVLDAGAFDVPEYQWGIASSPILYEGLVIVQCDVQKGSFIAAFDAATGNEVWRKERTGVPSWSTPTVIETPKGPELVTNGAEHMRGYEPKTGKELWSLKGTSMISVPTPFRAGDLIYLFSGYSRFQKATYAIRAGEARGDITGSGGALAWKRPDAPYLPTPVVYRGYVYTVNTRGEFFCMDAKTGADVYRERLGEGAVFSASLTAADGRIFASSEDGDVYVVKAGPPFEVIGRNRVGDVLMATPAFTRGAVVFRTPTNVIAFRTGGAGTK